MEAQEVYLRILEIVAQFFVGLIIFVATMKAPSRAVEDQNKREQEKQAKDRKLQIFYTLMQTRSERLSYRHIESLNMIDMEYNGINNIIDSWNEYLDNLNTSCNDADRYHLNQARDQLFVNMLYEMSKYLGYPYNKVDIKNKLYIPLAHSQEIKRTNKERLMQERINTLILDILIKSNNKGSLSVIIKKNQNRKVNKRQLKAS
jgi:hypothetical protein